MDESQPSIYLYLSSLETVARSASMLAGDAAIPVDEKVTDRFSSVLGKILEKIDALL